MSLQSERIWSFLSRAFGRAGLLRALLLLSMLLSATVPQGMMRVSSADGMQMVLCTEDGPQQMLLMPDGTLREVPVGDTDHAGACLAISVAFAGVQADWLPSALAASFPAALAPNTADVAPHLAPALAFASRGPPRLI